MHPKATRVRRRVPRVCEQCGVEFMALAFLIPHGKGRYCSLKCSAAVKAVTQLVPVADRFWAKVDRRGPDECWPWVGQVHHRTGYGQLRASGGKRSQLKAHRVAYEVANGPIPEGLSVCHTCDNRLCVNPAHLWTGTTGDNLRDMVSKGRHVFQVRPEAHARGERSGSAKLTEEKVREMRWTYALGGVTQKRLAVRFEVSHALVSFVITRRLWKHVV